MLVKKLSVKKHWLYCRCYADFVSASLFNQLTIFHMGQQIFGEHGGGGFCPCNF